MKTLLKLLSFVILLAASPANAESSEPSEISIKFVEQFSKQNFIKLAEKTTHATNTYQMILKAKPEEGEAIVDEEIKKSIEESYPEWRRNNALAWSSVLTDEEMRSIIDEGRSSPYISKMTEKQNEASEIMKNSSQQILIDTVSTALKKSFTRTVNQ